MVNLKLTDDNILYIFLGLIIGLILVFLIKTSCKKNNSAQFEQFVCYPKKRYIENFYADCAKNWQQCGGKDYSGPTCCESGATCVKSSDWWSMCKPGGSGGNPPPPPPPTPSPGHGGQPTPKPTSGPSPTTGPGQPTSGPSPTTGPGGKEIITQQQLENINAHSTGWWPKCAETQNKSYNTCPNDPAYGQYTCGYFCGPEYIKELNKTFEEIGLDGSDEDSCKQRKQFISQLGYETGYFTVKVQPVDDGAGAIHMLPQNWAGNITKMKEIFPQYASEIDKDSNGGQGSKEFFVKPKWYWRSAVAWFKGGSVVPGCQGKDLFKVSYDECTKCILGNVVDRSEILNVVNKNIPCN